MHGKVLESGIHGRKISVVSYACMIMGHSLIGDMVWTREPIFVFPFCRKRAAECPIAASAYFCDSAFL